MEFNHYGNGSEGLLNSSNTTTEPMSVAETFKWTDAEIARMIQIIFRPILVIVGTIGNCLTIYIMRRTSLKYLSTCFYMVVLALTDTIVLWSGCFISWVKRLTHSQVNPDTWTDCKFSYFLFYFGRHYSSTLLVLMSIEKCFAVHFPLKSKTVCTVKTAKWASGIVGLFLVGYNIFQVSYFKSHFLISHGLHFCIYNNGNRKIGRAIDSALYSFGPFVLMFITNFALMFKFMKAKCQGNSTESTNQALAKAATRGTAMVITVSVTFLLLTAPTAVDQALMHVIRLASNPTYEVFMNFTQYLNHSIKGLLYCIVGSRFRKELLKILCRKKTPAGSSNRNMIVATISRTMF